MQRSKRTAHIKSKSSKVEKNEKCAATEKYFTVRSNSAEDGSGKKYDEIRSSDEGWEKSCGRTNWICGGFSG